MATRYIITGAPFAVPREGGGMYSATPGDPLDPPADVLRDFGHLFHKVEWPDTEEPAPEAATAAPGKKRSTTRRKPAAKKKSSDG